jgi:hypothetical protein
VPPALAKRQTSRAGTAAARKEPKRRRRRRGVEMTTPTPTPMGTSSVGAMTMVKLLTEAMTEMAIGTQLQ